MKKKSYIKKLKEFSEPFYSYGKQLTVKLCYCQCQLKALFCFPSILLPRGTGSSWNPGRMKRHDSPLSAKVSFARIGPAFLKLPSDNRKKHLIIIICKYCMGLFSKLTFQATQYDPANGTYDMLMLVTVVTLQHHFLHALISYWDNF